jgi:hypothetical protein
MKARTSRSRFDERRRFTFVGEEMGRPRLDSDANEQAMIAHTDAQRRSGDLAEGAPDDGFLISTLNLADPVLGLTGWRATGLPPGDLRDIRQELGLARRDPDSLPQVIRARGVTALARSFPAPVDLLARPVSATTGAATFQAAAVIVQLRFDRPPTDDEVVDIRLVCVGEDGQPREVAPVDPAVQAGAWRQIRVPLAAFAAFPRSNAPGGAARLLLVGWGLTGLPPRAEVFVDALLAEDGDLLETDLVLRGGDGTVTGAGRIFTRGRRSFIEADWRYSSQPDLPNPAPLTRPGDLAVRHLLYLDLFDRPVHQFEDSFLEEPALAGEPTTFRSRLVTQIRAVALAPNAPPLPPAPMGNGLLTTNLAEGARPDRLPAEDPDPCRDRCLFSENISSGSGYRGKINAHVRIEVLHDGAGLAAPIIAWSRDNGAQVSPLVEDAPDTAVSVVVSPEEAARYGAGDLVVIEDDWTRLDPGRDGHRPVLRQVRAADTATGRLEFFAQAEALVEDPAALNVGGPLGRAFLRDRHAAVRRWDGADWLLTDVRYNLRDGIAFGLDGTDFRAGEYWSFTARIVDPDGGAFGVVEDLNRDPVHGPQRDRAAIGLVEWLPAGRRLIDLRRRFLPLDHVRDRLIELGRRRLSPGAFTVVVGDGVRTFGDIDQNLVEGVTGDEAIQTALARLGAEGGTIYIRAGTYILEHPVILQARSSVRILGDGAGTRLRVTGAGGAFHLDACGIGGKIALELMTVEETPAIQTPFGSAQPSDVILGPLPFQPVRPLLPLRPDLLDGILDGMRAARPLAPADLALAVAGPAGLVARLGETLRDLRPGFGRVGASIVRTLEQLRRLQRERPGQPLEDIAPDLLRVLQGLPHGVVTICDSRNITVARLDIVSRAASGGPGSVAAGVLVTGDCADIKVEDNRVTAPAGIVALPLARYLSTAALLALPRASLFLSNVALRGNDLRPLDAGRDGIAVADGRIDGLEISDNRVSRFLTGISVSDKAENRSIALDRIVVRDNQVIDVPEIGLSLDGDGIDVEANEIRLAAIGAGLAPLLRVGIRVTGSGVRIRDCWISLPASPQNRDPFALEAGVLFGAGSYGTLPSTRAVSDLEIVDTRIEGAGAATLADGILLSGPQPATGLRLLRNHVLALGGAAIRAMGHGGALGSLQITGNRIADVARSSPVWGLAAIRALEALEPRLAGQPGNATPRSLLERLLALDAPAQPAIDALLRWLDAALLRGGIVLAHVEGTELRDNTVEGVGTRALPPGFRDPGGEMRTAGILTMGGQNLAARANHVANVVGLVEPVVFLPPVIVGPVRPPLLDLLDRFRLEPLAPATSAVFVPGEALHKSIAGLRGKVAAFALLDDGAAAEGRAGLQLAVDSVLPSMRAAGGELAALAGRIAEATQMLSTVGGREETLRAADLLRGAVSDAAGITAPDPETARIWSMAGAFDRTTLAERPVIAEQAGVIGARVAALPKEQQAVVPELGALARMVIDNPADAVARRKLASETGKLALLVQTAQTYSPPAGAEAGVPAVDPALERRLASLRDMSRRIVAGLETAPGSTPAARLAAAEQPVTALLRLVEPLSAEAATRMRSAFVEVTSGRRVTEAGLTSLRKLFADESAAVIAAATANAPRVEGAAAGSLEERVAAEALKRSASLIAVAAKAVDTRIAEAASLDKLDEAFELRLAEAATLQLSGLIAPEDRLDQEVADAIKAITGAIEADDPDKRALLRERARFSLDTVARAGDVPEAATTTTRAMPADRLGGLAQAALEIGGYDRVEDRRDGVALFADMTERSMASLGLDAGARDGARKLVAEASRTLAQANPAPEARSAALAALASVASTVTTAAELAGTAAPETAPLAQLAAMTRIALSVEGSEEDRVVRVRDYLSSVPQALSQTLTQSLVAAPDLAGLIDRLGRGLGSITGVPPILRLPPLRPNGFRAHPADGIYCAAPGETVQIDDNQIAAARVGIVLAGAQDHPLAPSGQRLASVIVSGNRIERAPVAALDLRPDGEVALQVSDNIAQACSGSAEPNQTGHGQAVFAIVGRGELALNDNRLSGNGNAASAALLHEVLVDWRGDVTARGNRIRHAGASAGGTGLLILAADIDAALVGRLSREPALVVEPVPVPLKPVPSVKGGFDAVIPGLLSPEIFGLSMLASASRPAKAAQPFDFGALSLADATETISLASFTTGPREAPDVQTAVLAADDWFAARPALQPARPVRPVIDFLDLLPPHLFFAPVRARRSVQVVANDITAQGPALQVLNNGGALVSAGITGNDLETGRETAAVYLRQVDAVVFTGNRCEALREVNVAVLRCGHAAVTVASNGLIGEQPAALPPKPLPKPRPVVPGIKWGATEIGPGLSLRLEFGEGAGLTLPLRPEVLLEGLRTSDEHGVFGQSAREAESAFKIFAAEKAISPAVRIVNSGLLRSAGRLAAADNPPEDSEAVVLHSVLADPNLSAGGKLFGVAKFLQFSDSQARTLVARQLVEAGGDGAVALERGISVLAGSGEAGASVVTASAAPRALLEQMIGATIGQARLTQVFDPGKFTPLPLPLPPLAREFARDRSLVIVGGAKVAAVGNATTAGVYVHPGPDRVLLNV